MERRDLLKHTCLTSLPFLAGAQLTSAQEQAAATPVAGLLPRPEDFGAKGDGQADDTAAVRQASLANPGGMQLTPGKTYLIDQLVIPNQPNWTLEGGWATLKKRDGGDNYALVASENHLRNDAFAGRPVQIRNLRLDGADVGEKCVGLLLQSWNSRLFNLAIENMSGDGLRMAGASREGKPLTSTLVNNWIDMLTVTQCGGHGVHIDDAAGNKCTDWYLGGGWIYDNAGWGVYSRETAGSQIGPKLHLYSNEQGGLYAERTSIGTVVQGMYFEAGQTCALPGGWRSGIIAQCYFYGDARLEIGFASGGTAINKRAVVNQCHFTGKSHILHQGGPSRTIEVIGCLFDDPDPLRKARGGAYFATRCWADQQEKLLDGAI